ncbi:MAG TPA: translocation/assembly module TamB domain-containing protein [Thermoanaerobaculia bacterium]|nr:translocation/assembly module TamB domain-containing protein [Thermoanaerobaculia bacterium]
MSEAAGDHGAPETTRRARRSRARRALRAIALALLAVALGATALVLAVLLRPAGVRAVLDRAGPALGGELEYEQVGGRLWDQWTVTGLHYRQTAAGVPTGLEIRVDRLTVRWRPLLLPAQRLEVERIEAEGVAVRMAPAGPSQQPFDPPEVLLPLAVRVGTARIGPLVVTRPAGDDPEAQAQTWTVERVALVELRAAAAGGPIVIGSATVDAAEAGLEVSGTLVPTGDYPFDLETTWHAVATPAEGESPLQVSGGGPVRGTLRRVELQQRVRARVEAAAADAEPAVDASFAGTLDDPLETLHAELEVRWERLRWPLSGELFAESRGTVKATGSLEQVELEGTVSAGGPSLPAAELTLRGETDLRSLTATSLELRTLGSVIQGSGRLAWTPQVTWSADLEGRDLDPSVQWPEWPGRLSLHFAGSGSIDEQGVAHTDARIDRARGTLRGYPVAAELAFVAHGEAIEALDLDARSGDARLLAAGSASLDRVDVGFELDVPDLAQVLPEAAGRLSASGSLRGERVAPALSARLSGGGLAWRDIRLADVEGNVEAVLAGGGGVRATFSATELAAGTLTGRGLELDLTGALAEPIEDWATQSPVQARFDLAELETGALHARGIGLDLAGTLGEHTLALTADSAGQRGGEDATQRLRVRAEGGLAGVPDAARWSGTLSELGLDAPAFGRWALDSEIPVVVSNELVALGAGCWRRDQEGQRPAFVCGEGRWSSVAPWSVDARISNLPLGLLDPLLGEGRDLRGWLDGAIAASGTGTRVETARLELGRVEGSTRIELPDGDTVETPFREGEGELDLGPEGLRARAQVALPAQDGALVARLELPGYAPTEGWAPADGQPLRGTVSANLHDLAVLQALVPRLRDPAGSLEAEIELSGTTGRPGMSGRLALRDAAGRITGLDGEGAPSTLELELTDATLDARVDDAGAHLELAVRTVDPAGTVRGSVDLPGYRLALAAPPAEQPVRGTVDFALDGIAPVAALLPEIEEVTGEVHGAFTLGGTLGDPQVDGRADLTGFGGRIDALAVRLVEGEAHLRGRPGENLELTASVRSGPGTLEATGTVSNHPEGWQAVLRLSGSNVTVANTPEVRVRASPDLTLTLSEGAVDVRGDVELPWARIEIRELPERSIEPSADVVRVDLPPREPEPLPATTRVTGRVRLRFGDDFQFEGFGFDVDPRGSILITDTGRGSTTATGQLVLENGRYRAYGQNLAIESGRVLFGGGPIQNPALDVEAYRTVGTVKAGVRVGGTLERPVVTLASSPTMSENDILTYMMLGRPPGTVTSSSDDELLARAATSLGIRGGNLIARRLAARYGIDELGIETDGGVETASLVLGTYLSPRLYVSYGVGLFEPISTITLRYVLSSKWTLSAESGRGTGADLVYTIERGRRRGEAPEQGSGEGEPPPP